MKLILQINAGLAIMLFAYLIPNYTMAKTVSSISEENETPIGFYEGVINFSAHWDPIARLSGSLLKHDRTSNDNLVVQSLTGESPLMYLGIQPISPAFLREPVYNGTQTFLELEFGETNHIGLGVSWMQTFLFVTRQEQFPKPSSITMELESRPYTEVAPVTRKFFRDTILLGNVFYHFVSANQVDPYFVFRLGAGNMETAYRTAYNPFLNPYDYILRLRDPYSEGDAYVACVGLGINLHLIDEFGIKTEISRTTRYTHSSSYVQETLTTTLLSFGVILSLDGI